MDQRLISADSHVRITEDWVRERLPATALASYKAAVQALQAIELEQRGGTRQSLEDFGDLAPGAKISEPALAREYGVSRGPLREALHRLQERKLITRSANQGPRIVRPSAETVAELFVVREALEGMAARLAARHATEREIAALRAIVAGSTPITGGEDSSEAAFDERHDRDFHFTIAQCSRNPMLIDLLCAELYPLLRLYRGMPVGFRPRVQRAAVEHERIVSAIADRDPDLAEMLMRRHIAAARARRETALAQASGVEPTSLPIA